MAWGLIGQQAATSALAAMTAGGRLPHALLFTGPRGGGKSSLARSLAAALNCADLRPDGSPCGLCLSCLKVAKDVHPDLKTIAPEGAANLIKMEAVSALRGEMAFRPFEGRVKVFIIKEADRLSPESGNALLKTLEEPPPDSHLFLTSASEAEVMPTILSRCLRLRLPPLATDLIIQALAEKRGVVGPRADLAAALAAGALGPALAMDLDQSWADWEELNKIMDGQGPAALAGALAWSMKTAADKAAFAPAQNLLRLWWRQTARLWAGGPVEGPPPHPAQQKWAARLNPGGLEKINQAQGRLADSLARFVKPELAFENYWLAVLSL